MEQLQIICPKCGQQMRQYERNGVVVDQCVGCRGIFLDAGELERLTAAADAYYAGGGGMQPQPRPRDYDHRGYDDRHRGGYGYEYKKKKKKKGFFDELFD